jgi:hypothetical protein
MDDRCKWRLNFSHAKIESMLSISELTRLLKSPESPWVERKPTGVSVEKIRNTLVAFANSVSEEQHAVLFIGVSDDGKLQGVNNADQKQRDVREIAEQRCYPPVKCEPISFRVDGVDLVAVVVGPSTNRPHFSGHAYIRVGSETKKASPEQFEELITCRNDKIRRLLQEKDKIATIFWDGKEAPYISSASSTVSPCKPRFAPNQPFEAECIITACDSSFLRFNVIAVGDGFFREKREISPIDFSVPVDKVSLGFDNKNQRIKLFINY